jgi:2-desacetyl-2-hydroxyethyl bacteriochlorophyllide A dehydrogenase
MLAVKAFVITGPREAGVEEVEEPVPAPGEVVVDVRRSGICGTDVELFTGDMPYLRTGRSWYPLRIGHEWVGEVREAGEGVDAGWIGRRVVGDTMLGCGRCRRCRTGFHHVCSRLVEVGISLGRPGAMAERLAVPASSLHPIPDAVDDALGALVEPGGNAVRAVRGADLARGDRLLVAGAGPIGLLAGLFARAAGADVHLVGRSARSIAFARALGFDSVGTWSTLPDGPWDAVIDATNDPTVPARAADLVEPGRRVVCIGLASEPSPVDSRVVVLRDVIMVGILGASHGLDEAIAAYASGAVDPRPLVGANVPLAGLAGVLAGGRPADAGAGPKIHVTI